MPVTVTQGPGRAILDSAIKSLSGTVVKVGWFETSKYPDGTPVAYIAAIMEFGFAPKNIPPRLGLRQLTIDKKAEWSSVAEILAKRAFDGADPLALMEGLGGKVAGDIQKRISDVQEPALAESTLRNRANRLGIPLEQLSGTGRKPLVEPVMKDGGSGGLLLATVQWLVQQA